MLAILRFLGKIFLFIFFRVKYSGRENIPRSGAYLVCSNHISNLDVLLIGVNFKRRVHWMAKEELFKYPVFSQIIKAFGAYPVARGKSDGKAVDKTLELLEQENFVGIFPQGTRSRGKRPEEINAKYGAAKFAIMSGKPVMPIRIAGTGKLFSRITVVFGKPYKLDNYPLIDYTKDEYQKISQKIMDDLFKMSGDV